MALLLQKKTTHRYATMVHFLNLGNLRCYLIEETSELKSPTKDTINPAYHTITEHHLKNQ